MISPPMNDSTGRSPRCMRRSACRSRPDGTSRRTTCASSALRSTPQPPVKSLYAGAYRTGRLKRSRCRSCELRCRIASATGSPHETCRPSPICRGRRPPRHSCPLDSASMPRWFLWIRAPMRSDLKSTRACPPPAARSPARATPARTRESSGMRIGPYVLPSPVVLAPMAGVTDRPFRVLCRKLGAGLAASEMLTSDTRLWNTPKSRYRMSHEGEPEPRIVQLAGADPEALAQAARLNVEHGAQIIDLNMGCPAKKVCGKLCGSALLQDEGLVARILDAVVSAVSVPVTLKIRTGWDREHRNGVSVAQIAERCGVQGLAVHGRTRADFYEGAAEYETIRDIKSAVRIPVFANGDIRAPHHAREVL